MSNEPQTSREVDPMFSMVQHLVDGSITFSSVSISLGIDSCWSFVFFSHATLWLHSMAFFHAKHKLYKLYIFRDCSVAIPSSASLTVSQSPCLARHPSPNATESAFERGVELALVACTVLAFP